MQIVTNVGSARTNIAGLPRQLLECEHKFVSALEGRRGSHLSEVPPTPLNRETYGNLSRRSTTHENGTFYAAQMDQSWIKLLPVRQI